ncbi:hypothetical protein EV673_1152 [Limnobacter thiooxidans]|uniref:Lipoprotein n=1 Tax=Limnobacter thiooxidans TaxID=131080 RepID=A0AA86MB26_9BURK|nr:hypothetical protein [Limnobacter sp.]MCZ8015725.1 hypothetical protein [Limnobacter sp.]RZS42808.1 hypothetical protein EV673_1152 [Limnobacter thiooxidans]BET25753.1 hypothetical protein RGQ30_12540 [Limnobacter thiooxidans]
MKVFFGSIVGACVLVISACTNSPETSNLKLPYFAKTDCQLVYKARGVQVIENFCETEWKPVKLYIQDQKYSVDWIDEKTSRQIFETGCMQPGACYYELKMDGFTVNGRFAYAVDGIQGDFVFEIDANENLQLLDQTESDLSS